MKNIIKIFKTDLKNIAKKRAAVIVIVALMILPSMYAWFNILPSWDPYANTSGVNVAVVNLDSGAIAEGKSFNVGAEIVNSLSENDQLGWQFVDEEEASKKVQRGDYYASIIIPEDFSKKLASVINEKPEKPILDYYINEKINAIAPKVTSAGASGIVENIQSGFVKVTNEAIFTAFNDIGIELESNRAEIERFRDTVYSLEKELPEIERLLQLADTDLKTVETAVERVNEGMGQAEQLSKDAGETSERIEQMIIEADQSVEKYVPIVKKDLQLSQQYVRQVPSIVNKAHEKGIEIDEFLDQLVTGTTKIDKGVEVLQKLAELLASADEQLTEERNLEKLNESLQAELDRLQQLQLKIAETIEILKSGNHPGVDLISDLNNQVKEVSRRLTDFIIAYEETILPAVKEQINFLREQSATIHEKLTKAHEKIGLYIDQVDQWIEESPLSPDEQLEYIQQIQPQIETRIEELEKIKVALIAANQIDPEQSYDEAILAIERITEKLTIVNDTLLDAKNKLEDGEDLTETIWPYLKEQLEKVANQLDELLQAEENLTKIFNQTIEQLEEISTDLQISITLLQETVTSLEQLTEQLVESVSNPEKLLLALEKAAAKIAEGEKALQALIDFNNALQNLLDDGFILDGMEKVEDLKAELIELKRKILQSVGEVKQNKQSLGVTLDKTATLSIEIDKAITKLITYLDNELMPKYRDASSRAHNAIVEGNKLLAKAKDYFPKLQEMLINVDAGVGKGQDGIKKAREIFPEAEEKIKDISNKLRNLEEQGDLDKIIRLMKNDPNLESDFLSDPLFLEEHELFPIPNYGSAMAPFFTAMSLWVGGLILVSSLIVDVPNKHLYKSYEAYFGRFITFWLIGLMQALIVTTGNLYLLKTYVAHKLMYILFAFIISTTFVIIIYTFVSVFGNTGKVIAIILLVMQLGASGGTFPIQMTPDFFQKIHAFLPFTHALGLFREAVGGIIWPVVLKHIAWLFAYGGIFLFIGIKLKETINRRSDKFLEEARESKVIL